MAESSSDSDSLLRNRTSRRGPLRATHVHARSRGAADMSEKIHTLANTLQDTSRNLRRVDEMLGQYKDYNSDKTEVIETLKENLEQSIDQLRSQRLSRLSGVRSASLSSLCASDLDTAAGNGPFQPTSPIREYRDSGIPHRRRSRSANVRFLDESNPSNRLHSLHQSLRDLSSDQVRLSDDFSRESSRRNRTDAEIKKTLEELNSRLNDSQREESASERVERKLLELERDMRSERQHVERRQDHLGQVSVQLQQALKQKENKTEEVDLFLKDKLSRSETEKSQLEAELERYKRRMDQIEGSRETLLYQVEDLRSQLGKVADDRNQLQRQVSRHSLQSQSENREEERRMRAAVERSEHEKQELECQITQLRAQLNRSVIMTELEDLKRTLEQKDHEKTQLAKHVEALTSGMEKRERQQLQMLETLKDIQGRFETCEKEKQLAEDQAVELGQQLEEMSHEAERYLVEFRQAETLRLETEKKKEQLKVKAQETVKQWRLKCKKLEKMLDKKEEYVSQATDRSAQTTKEKDDAKSQLQASLQQIESLRKELSEVISKRAQQEEDLHLREIRLSQAREQHLELERDLREAQEMTVRLQGELQRQAEIQQQLQEDRERLQEDILTTRRAQEKTQERIVELQEDGRQRSVECAELSSRLTQEEKANKELRKNLCEAQKQAEFAREELTSAGRQLKMERDVHQRELADLRLAAQSAKSKHERSVQEMLAHFRQEREELENHIQALKAELLDNKSLVKSERQRVEKMKVECDKLSEEASHWREENTTLRSKYQLAVQDADEKEKRATSAEQTLNRLRETNQSLQDRLSSLETEQETILGAIELEINSACQLLSMDFMEKFKAMSVASHLRNDPHYWLAETKTKLQWLCQEVKERQGRERKMRGHVQQCREQLKELKLSKESEQETLRQQIQKHEQQLEEAQRENNGPDHGSRTEHASDTRGNLVSCWKGAAGPGAHQQRRPRNITGKICLNGSEFTESTRMALDHLESVPEKLSLLDDMKQLSDSCKQREVMEERHAQYREIVGSLQQQLEDSKRHIQEYREEKTRANAQSAHLAALSSSLRGNGSFLSSSWLSDSISPTKRNLFLQDGNQKGHTHSSTVNGTAH
uniref:Centrosomal protein 128 n=1 Tax=Leptobrachium leishanense TaxID=445787 RepID=A0A8C5QZ13_9ANUR